MPQTANEPVIDPGTMIMALASAEGSACHRYTHSAELNAGPFSNRNLADMLHLFSMLHGAHPGLIDRVSDRNVLTAADYWLEQAAVGFAGERSYLTQLIAAAGPVPSTAGEAECASALRGCRHALEIIAQSDRIGCAIGAVAAMVFDWTAIRSVLDTAAERLGVEIPACTLPDGDATGIMLMRLPPQPRFDRTLAFGARQLLDQHRGIWDLLEARAGVREPD